MYTPAAEFKKSDRKYISGFYQAVNDIYDEGESEIRFTKSDLQYLCSLRARMDEPGQRERIQKILVEIRKGGKPDFIFEKSDIKFLQYIIGIIS